MIADALPRVVQTRDDVLALMPDEYRRADSAPVRDALADALLALLVSAQDASDFAAAQTDPSRAVAECEDGLFEDRGVPRAQGETDDEVYRERALSVPATVTFEAIRDAANVILATVTDKTCRLSDATLDRWFIGGAAPRAWHSHIGRGPNYPERFYQDNAPNNPGGQYMPGNDPGGARVFSGQNGRAFLLRVPDLAKLSDAKVTPGAGTDPATHKNGFFVGQPTARAYISGGQYAVTIYRAIVSTVNAIVGHSVRWTLVADPKLA